MVHTLNLFIRTKMNIVMYDLSGRRMLEVVGGKLVILTANVA